MSFMSDQVTIPIKKSAREYGYVIWSNSMEGLIKELIGEPDTIEVVFQGQDLGEKNVDWQYHRISLGPKQTESLPPEKTEYVLRTEDNRNRLHVICR